MTNGDTSVLCVLSRDLMRTLNYACAPAQKLHAPHFLTQLQEKPTALCTSAPWVA